VNGLDDFDGLLRLTWRHASGFPFGIAEKKLLDAGHLEGFTTQTGVGSFSDVAEFVL
jgi:hypothetical protein